MRNPKIVLAMGLAVSVAMALMAVPAYGATEQEKQAAIDQGLAWLNANASTSLTEAWWPYTNDGTLAATASAALAFIEEGHYPGSGTAYETTATKAIAYVFNRAKTETLSAETAGYWRHAEDYNNSGAIEIGEGNGQGLWFDPASFKRDIYTNGIVAPMIYALGQAKGKDTVIGIGSAAISGLTYSQAMQDVVDWFSWGQVEPDKGIYRGGWRYTPNYASADNSTAQWGALPYLYAQSWGLQHPDYVMNELNLWVNQIQNPINSYTDWKDGGSGYTNNTTYVNMAKTAGLLLELAAMGVPKTDPRVQNALYYMVQSTESFDHWNQSQTSWPDQWNGGNLGNPYSMWAVFKALFDWGFITKYGTDPDEDFWIGNGLPTPNTVPGGFQIGQDWWDGTGGGPSGVVSLSGDWYSHYCDWLVGAQNANGSWNGYSYWTGALATSWDVNILNAAGAPPPVQAVIPEPLTCGALLLGLGGMMGYIRKRRRA